MTEEITFCRGGGCTTKLGPDLLSHVLSKIPKGEKDPDLLIGYDSKGHLEEILEVIRKKNPQARIVLNAISLETLVQILEYCRKYPIKNDEIVQVNIAKSKLVGGYHMMTGQNPIYVVSFELD